MGNIYTESRELHSIETLWSGDSFAAKVRRPYPGFEKDYAFVKGIAKGKYGDSAHFHANRLLGNYYAARGAHRKAIRHMRQALSDTLDAVKRAQLYMAIYTSMSTRARHGRRAEEARLECYEQFAYYCFQGLLAGERRAICLAKNGVAEQLGDYALLGMADYVWSVHPENQNTVDRVRAEERSARYFEKFLAKGDSPPNSPWGRRRREYLPQFEERAKREVQRYDLRRALYLRLRGAVEEESAQAPIGSVQPVTPQERQIAEDLAERTKAFQTQYGQTDILRIPPVGLYGYIDLARGYMQAISDGNAAVLKQVVEDPKIFKQMWDYIIPVAANVLWAVHPSNTDPSQRQQAREQGRYWLDVCFGDMVDGTGEMFLFKKWKARGLMEWPTRRKEWLEFLKNVAERVDGEEKRGQVGEKAPETAGPEKVRSGQMGLIRETKEKIEAFFRLCPAPDPETLPYPAILAYIDLAYPVVQALMDGDVELARFITFGLAPERDPFLLMDDYSIKAGAAALWGSVQEEYWKQAMKGLVDYYVRYGDGDREGWYMIPGRWQYEWDVDEDFKLTDQWYRMMTHNVTDRLGYWIDWSDRD